MNNIGKVLVGLGLFLSVLGIIFIVGDRFGLGRLPGDIILKRGNFTFFFPIVSSIIVSIILSIIIKLFK